MNTLRSTFILRCWHLPDGTARVAIEHVQSGERAHAVTLAAALDWLVGRTGAVQAVTDLVNAEGIASAEEESALHLADP